MTALARVLAAAAFLGATAAHAASEAERPAPAAPAAEWDAVAEKKGSPYYDLEAYLRLTPRSQVGNHAEMPALLANGACADPAGEGR